MADTHITLTRVNVTALVQSIISKSSKKIPPPQLTNSQPKSPHLQYTRGSFLPSPLSSQLRSCHLPMGWSYKGPSKASYQGIWGKEHHSHEGHKKAHIKASEPFSHTIFWILSRQPSPVRKSSYFLGDPPPDPRFHASLDGVAQLFICSLPRYIWCESIISPKHLHNHDRTYCMLPMRTKGSWIHRFFRPQTRQQSYLYPWP